MDKILYTILIAGAGGYVGVKLKVPAGALLGAMVFVAAYNIYTGQGNIPKNFKLVAQMLVGGMIGLNFTMDTIYELKKLIVPALTLVIGLTVFSIFLGFIISKLTGLDLVTALFSSSPGGITDMVLISEAYGAEIHKVALLHLIRLITVITVLPLAIKFFSQFVKS